MHRNLIRNLLASGFESESPIVDPKVVKITGAKNVIDQIKHMLKQRLMRRRK